MNTMMTTLDSCGIVYCGFLCLLENIPSMFLMNKCQVGSFLYNFVSVFITALSKRPFNHICIFTKQNNG